MNSKQLLESALAKYKEGLYDDAILRFLECEELEESKFYIGLSLEKGNGVKKDVLEAIKWYIQAAEKGYPSAMFRLGLCYENGIDVPKNLGRAKYWYEMGSKAGNPGATAHLEFLSMIPVDKPDEEPNSEDAVVIKDTPAEPKSIPKPKTEKTSIPKPKDNGNPTNVEGKSDKSLLGRSTKEKKVKQKKESVPSSFGIKIARRQKKFAIYSLSLIGILIFGSAINGLLEGNSTRNDIANTKQIGEDDLRGEKQINVDTLISQSPKKDYEDTTCSMPSDAEIAIAKDNSPAIAKDNSSIARDRHGTVETGYRIGTIGSSQARMYIPRFLKGSGVDGNEKIYFGSNDIKIITQSSSYSGLPNEFLAEKKRLK